MVSTVFCHPPYSTPNTRYLLFSSFSSSAPFNRLSSGTQDGVTSELPVQPRHRGSCSFLMLQKLCQCLRKLHFSCPKGRLGDRGTRRSPELSIQRLSLFLCPSALGEGHWVPHYSFSSRKEGVTLPVVTHAQGRCWLSMC